ncbi:MAG: thioredoxin family protein [Alphaproteobacteria bacterium]|nr:thioredoxin family protein [Alphaproteobacteria bacterium]
MIARAALCVWILTSLAGLSGLPAQAAELVLFEAADCVWCEAWDAEIGEIYPRAAEARIAPLRRVDILAERPADLAGVRGIIYTPTFVLMEGGDEVGRITGYAGEEFFWGLLGIEMKKLDGEATAANGVAGPRQPSLYEQGEGH